MSFDATARVAPEKQDMSACLPMVSSMDDERTVMTEQELQAEIADMWRDMRAGDELIVDAPARKVGMPWAVPYEGVCFPVEIEGRLELVSIPVDKVAIFAAALLEMIKESIAMDREADAEIATSDAITKAKGR